MKPLPLKVILKKIKGTVARGGKDLTIEHVTYRQTPFRKTTLFFQREGRSSWSSKRELQPSVLVTDDPHYYLKRTEDYVVIVAVKNIEKAYSRFIKFYRSLFSLPVIGVTGTCGKTTTTEMIRQILSSKFKVQATEDGENGSSMNIRYLTGIDDRTEAAVFELGTNAPGVIRRSCKYFQPNVGIILNIGVYHLQHCKTLEAYIQAKAEMLEGIKPGGTLILNADDENIKKISLRSFKGKVIYIGLGPHCDYRAERVKKAEGGITFRLYYKDKRYKVFVPGYGKHNVYNALAAIAACHAIGMRIDESIALLSKYKQMRMHMEFKKGVNGCTIIDDTWNCTPPSMKAALDVLKEQAKGRDMVAVLGFMPQLGKEGQSQYTEMGKYVANMRVKKLILVDQKAKPIGLSAIKEGMDPRRVEFCHTAQEVYHALLPHLNRKTLVLLKFPYYYVLMDIPPYQTLMRKIFAE